MKIKVSVIIPVYNAERYLPECIESLLAQTLEPCEFIFVNDGSEDRSREIVETYQTRDARIQLINQPNRGVSAARNAGLLQASGEYAGFVDADDWVKPAFFETMYEAAKEDDCDAVMSNLEGEQEGVHRVVRYGFQDNRKLDRTFIEKVLLPYFLKADDLNTVCCKLFKNRLIQDHAIKFPDHMVLGEDGWFNMSFFRFADSVKYLDYAGYCYRETPGSATRNLVYKDYFGRSLEVYETDFAELFGGLIQMEDIFRLKSIKLIRNVLAYIHLYSMPSNELSFSERCRKIKQMISHRQVRRALQIFYDANQHNLGRYEKWLLTFIQLHSVLGLYGLTVYSRLRDKKTGGIS